ncbi:MAG: phenylalanine--tRNA ligase subunit alpha [Candidatus Kapabacteria bacterium]|nr:phenylalanine--tRNA ligase subunit alpha [Candidatus Kapabacteria bacterium]
MSLQEELQQLRRTIDDESRTIASAQDAEAFRLRHLVKKGTIQACVEQLRSVPKEQKPQIGKLLNEVRTLAESIHANAVATYAAASAVKAMDVTLAGRGVRPGAMHPITQTVDRLVGIFASMGFDVAEGPDIEDDAHNFEYLNFAPDHPARDMQDTFFVDASERSDILLRTHTSSVQVRVMQQMKPPIRCIMPGRVYRNEAVSARSLAEFHQIEGLYIDKGVSMADLKGTIMAFARRFYDENAEFRFRTSFFPFTEPSCEVDMSCFLCKGQGCRICKHSGWLEICGAGMVHPNVLRACGIDPDEYSGFAFGFGVERVVMMLTGIDDIRMLYENDVRIIGQFAP